MSEMESLSVMVAGATFTAGAFYQSYQSWRCRPTAGEVRAFLGLAGFLRNFKYSSALTPLITNFLRNGVLALSQPGTTLYIPPSWRHAQTEAFSAIVRVLTSRPVLVTLGWPRDSPWS